MRRTSSTSALAKFCRDNPAVSLDIISTREQPNLDQDTLDVAFTVTHQVSLPDSSFSARQVGSFARLLYASKVCLRRHGTPQTPQDLQQHSCIRYLDSAAETTWRLIRGRKDQTVAVGGRCASSSVVVSAQEHVDIAMVPRHLASHPTFGAGLVRVLTEWEGTPVNVFAVTADRKLPARLEELIRVVRSELTKRLAQLEAAPS